jgi:hypothetical protein
MTVPQSVHQAGVIHLPVAQFGKAARRMPAALANHPRSGLTTAVTASPLKASPQKGPAVPRPLAHQVVGSAVHSGRRSVGKEGVGFGLEHAEKRKSMGSSPYCRQSGSRPYCGLGIGTGYQSRLEGLGGGSRLNFPHPKQGYLEVTLLPRRILRSAITTNEAPPQTDEAWFGAVYCLVNRRSEAEPCWRVGGLPDVGGDSVGGA